MDLDLSGLETVARMAEEFGPFLFAILFILFIPKIAHGYYKEANTRKRPPASQQERNTYRLYFISSVWCGVIVMALSIAWWVYAQSRGSNVYQIAITRLGEDDIVDAPYFRRLQSHSPTEGLPSYYDALFVVVRDQPFRTSDKFEFWFYKKPSAGAGVAGRPVGKQVAVPYRGQSSDTYTLSFEGDVPKLTAVVSDDRTRRLTFTPEEIRRLASRPEPAGIPTGTR